MRYLMVLFFAMPLFAGVVDIPNPRVAVVTPAVVVAECHGTSNVGCTSFREVWMTCRCERKSDGSWSIRGSVRAVPVTFLTRAQDLRHEMLHVNDFRYFVSKHLEALAARPFATFGQCDRYATLATNLFSRTLESISRISTTLRDARWVETSEDHLIVMKAEVVPQLVDDRFPDLADDFAAAVSHAENRTSKNGDLIRQRR